MTLEEIKAYLSEHKDDEGVKAFLAALSKPAEITLGDFKKFATDNADAKSHVDSLINSEADRRVTKAIDTFKTETMPGIIEEAVKKANPDETPEPKRFACPPK